VLVLNRFLKARIFSELQICNVIYFTYYSMSDASDPLNNYLLFYNREYNKIDRLIIRDFISVNFRKT
jgi:hypothetical protein